MSTLWPSFHTTQLGGHVLGRLEEPLPESALGPTPPCTGGWRGGTAGCCELRVSGQTRAMGRQMLTRQSHRTDGRGSGRGPPSSEPPQCPVPKAEPGREAGPPLGACISSLVSPRPSLSLCSDSTVLAPPSLPSSGSSGSSDDPAPPPASGSGLLLPLDCPSRSTTSHTPPGRSGFPPCGINVLGLQEQSSTN